MADTNHGLVYFTEYFHAQRVICSFVHSFAKAILDCVRVSFMHEFAFICCITSGGPRLTNAWKKASFSLCPENFAVYRVINLFSFPTHIFCGWRKAVLLIHCWITFYDAKHPTYFDAMLGPPKLTSNRCEINFRVFNNRYSTSGGIIRLFNYPCTIKVYNGRLQQNREKSLPSPIGEMLFWVCSSNSVTTQIISAFT